MSMLAERWAPHCTDELVGQAVAVAATKRWLASWRRGRALLLWGPTGCGKTALVRALATEQQLTLVELDVEDIQRRPDLISAVQQATLKGNKLILIDEIDRADAAVVGAIAKIITTSSWPVMLTANNPYLPSLKPLRAVVDLVKLAIPRPTDIESRLLLIAAQEGMRVDRAALRAVALNAGGDVRAALNDLELLAVGALPGGRERKVKPFELLRTLFSSRSAAAVRSALEHSELDIDEIFLWLATNIPLEYTEPATRARAFEILSKADLWRKRNIQTAISLLEGLTLIAKPHAFVIYRPPEKPLAAVRAERVVTDAVCEQLAAQLHCSRRDARRIYLPFLRVAGGLSG